VNPLQWFVQAAYAGQRTWERDHATRPALIIAKEVTALGNTDFGACDHSGRGMLELDIGPSSRAKNLDHCEWLHTRFLRGCLG
jgi:hypothetical protein